MEIEIWKILFISYHIYEAQTCRLVLRNARPALDDIALLVAGLLWGEILVSNACFAIFFSLISFCRAFSTAVRLVLFIFLFSESFFGRSVCSVLPMKWEFCLGAMSRMCCWYHMQVTTIRSYFTQYNYFHQFLLKWVKWFIQVHWTLTTCFIEIKNK